MTQYLITKREKCEQCGGKGYRLVDEDPLGIGLPCPCVKGYIDTPVDLLEVLAKVRWTEIGDIITNNGYEKGVVDLRFNNLTIEDWQCSNQSYGGGESGGQTRL